jgi:outer membrane protein assembly factor BamB
MNGRARTIGMALAAVAIAAGTGWTAEEAAWPRWRGPRGDGISQETNWSAASLAGGPKVLWRASVGAGYSAVSVAGGRLYTLGSRDEKDVVSCLDAGTGKMQWEHSYACDAGDYAGPRATPALDGGSVYTFSRAGHVFCLDTADGKVKWSRDLAAEMKAMPPQWGFSGSPVIEGDMLLLNAGKSGVALDKATGKTLWASEPAAAGYASPTAFETKGGKGVALFGAKALYGVDAKSGRKLWEFPWETSYDVNAADPVVSGSRIFISSGYGRGCALLDVASGQPTVVWQNKAMRNHFGSCLLIEGCLYGIDGNAGRGVLRCLAFATGTEKWNKDVGFGSVTAAGGKLIVLNEKGEVIVAEASPVAYRETARCASLGSPKFWTVPVLCGGRLYCRNDKGALVCLDLSR